MKGLDNKVVDNFSSKLDLAREQETVETIDANHMKMARCSGKDDTRYRQVYGVLKHFIRAEISNAQSGVGNLGKQADNSSYVPLDSENQTCLQGLAARDPRDDKNRIEDMKGGMLKDSYTWILENSEFQQWYDSEQSELLWIRGDPGKGKTMLLCGIIDKLKGTPGVASASRCCLLSYFFCQATDTSINNAIAVLRGLIYLLADQQPALLQHVRKKYDAMGENLFVDPNAWFALSGIFTNILQDPSLERTYVIIDALDECEIGLQQLLKFIDKTSSVCPRVKWIISSRNWPSIEEQLHLSGQKVQLRLELNQNSISAAVSTYIEYKVGELAKRKKYTAKLEKSVREYLSLNADATFLWVALVLRELDTIDRRIALETVKMFPPGLYPLYQQMMDQVSKSNNADLCKRILSIVAVVKRPITLEELVYLDNTMHKLDCPEDLSEDIEDIKQTASQCGSFLTIRDSTIYFVHQSAKDFLLQEKTSQEIFRSGIGEVHYAIFWRSLQVMSIALRRDIYSLKAPGITIGQVKQPDSDPLSAIRYSCIYWVDHLLDSLGGEDTIIDPKGSEQVHDFLCQYFLYWLEAISLLNSMSKGIIMIQKLEDLQFTGSLDLSAFIHDARRFAISNRSIIEQAPLQVYCSALVFAPENSIVRKTFEKRIPSWIHIRPRVETHWNAMLQVLEGHTAWVSSVAFSSDGNRSCLGLVTRPSDAGMPPRESSCCQPSRAILLGSGQSPSPRTASRSCLGLVTRPSDAGMPPRESSCCQPSRAILLRSAQSPSPRTASRSCLGLMTRPSDAGMPPRESSCCQPSRAILLGSAQSPSPRTASRSQRYTFQETG
ncbi:NACHT domain-containing protein [Amylocarpus encephaloides]|uniref:NACHT domain-containing protein n=1 Tax=Amylocarpus encephaloides TaxID=45428 RepID=A0A9P7YIR8_9HELO|nr:NACHT domain-containing protein [Amylocarpus encephaloides]